VAKIVHIISPFGRPRPAGFTLRITVADKRTGGR
jgi:hypothetical protein